MKILEHIREIKEPFVLTIGNYDGCHLGHQYLLKQLRSMGEKKGIKSCLITFEPHPHIVLRHDKGGFLINTLKEKKSLLQEFGLDYFIALPFTGDLSKTSPEDFIERYILSQFLKGIQVGKDFCFGQDKEGDGEFLKKYFSSKNLKVHLREKFLSGLEAVSSSRIRTLVCNGQFEQARALLGRNFFLSGDVMKGRMRGRTIGFPTANLMENEKRVYPLNGVYITATTYRGKLYPSVTNIGVKPTFEEGSKRDIETHIFDCDLSLYGEEIRVEFFRKLRAEQKFPSIAKLVSQITLDISAAKAFFRD